MVYVYVCSIFMIVYLSMYVHICMFVILYVECVCGICVWSVRCVHIYVECVCECCNVSLYMCICVWYVHVYCVHVFSVYVGMCVFCVHIVCML